MSAPVGRAGNPFSASPSRVLAQQGAKAGKKPPVRQIKPLPGECFCRRQKNTRPRRKTSRTSVKHTRGATLLHEADPGPCPLTGYRHIPGNSRMPTRRRILGGPFDDVFSARLSAPRALCKSIVAVIPASTVSQANMKLLQGYHAKRTMSIVSFHKILKETKAVLAAGRPNRAQTGGLPHKRGGHNIASKKPAQLRLQRRGTLFEQGSCTTRHSFLKK